MGKKDYDENFIHICDKEKVELTNYRRAIPQMGYSNDEVIRIVDFYIFNAPIGKSDNSGLRTLKDYGWVGNELSKLEGKLLNASGISSFCIKRSSSIEGTLEKMNLKDQICISHPRAVIKQDCKIELLEDGTTKVSDKETRMVCLFRHIRNSLAHNLSYYFSNDFILLEDRDENKNISSRILMPKKSLVDWIDIVESKNMNPTSLPNNIQTS